jgi:hypothetical protein
MIIRWISLVPSKMVKILELAAVYAGQQPAYPCGISTDSARSARDECRVPESPCPYWTALDIDTNQVLYKTRFRPEETIPRRSQLTSHAGKDAGADAEPEKREQVRHVYLAPLRDARGNSTQPTATAWHAPELTGNLADGVGQNFYLTITISVPPMPRGRVISRTPASARQSLDTSSRLLRAASGCGRRSPGTAR